MTSADFLVFLWLRKGMSILHRPRNYKWTNSLMILTTCFQQCVISWFQVLPAAECLLGGAGRPHCHAVKPQVWEDGGGESREHQQGEVQHSGMRGHSGRRAGLHALLHQWYVVWHITTHTHTHTAAATTVCLDEAVKVGVGACLSVSCVDPLLVLTLQSRVKRTVTCTWEEISFQIAKFVFSVNTWAQFHLLMWH